MVDNEKLWAEVKRIYGWVERHYWKRDSYLRSSNGRGSADRPLITDKNGKLDNSFLDIDSLITGTGDTRYLKIDGTTDLTGEWDIGEDMSILAERIEARDAEGLTIQDDGGNAGVVIADGGNVTLAVGGAAFTQLSSGMAHATFAAATNFTALVPGSITTAQTWTVEIKNTLTGNNRGAVIDIMFNCYGSTTALGTMRVAYSATIAFDRNTVGSVATVRTTTVHINDVVGATLTGPTAIANGIRFTLAPSGGTLNRVVCQIQGNTVIADISSAVA